MLIEKWEHFFKPEVRRSGHTLMAQGKVSIAQPSDTEIVVYIRTPPPLKVTLKSPSMASNLISADCSCPAGKKGMFCKHIWAGLLATEQKNPDFFDSKTEIEKATAAVKDLRKPTVTSQSQERTQAWEEKQAAFKEKQNTYRKEQYQKQKLRLKKFKKNKKDFVTEVTFSKDVEKALGFFSQNGFELRETLTKEVVGAAMKKLARIFHPDLGGSHEESLELNKHTNVLIGFIKK